MQPLTTCGGLAAALTAWLLLLPPLSVTPAGKNFVDTGAPLFQWETFSTLSTDTQCRKHRDALRAQLANSATAAPKSSSGKKGGPSRAAFATLRERAAAARCVSSTDPRLHTPAATATAK
jgi:hypothetical protein